VAWQIAEYVKQARISKVVLGRSTTKRKILFVKPNFSERLTQLVPQLDIYIIPDKTNTAYAPKEWSQHKQEKASLYALRDLGITAASLAACTLIGQWFDGWQMRMENIILLYLLAALIPAFFTNSWWYSLLVSVGSVLSLNFFFSEPRYTLHVYDSSYVLTFAIVFVVSFITGFLTRKVRRQAELASRKAYRTEVLLETGRLLQSAEGIEAIYRVLAQQLERLLARPVVIYDGPEGQPHLYQHAKLTPVLKPYVAADERAVAAWVYKNNKHAGAGTNTLPGAKCLYLAVRVRDKAVGVVGIAAGHEGLTAFEYNVVISILGSGSLALEKEYQRQRRQKVELAAKQEKLRGDLLRGISHDLRTPLTTIAGSADLLLQEGCHLPASSQQELCGDIANDARWLIHMVENLLAVTRIQDGVMQINREAEVLGDIIQEARQHLGRRQENYPLAVELEDDYMMVRVDGRLLVQVFLNLLDNAMKYTPEGTKLYIRAYRQAALTVVEVADEGAGIPAAAREHLFDMFGSGKPHSADSRRGLGIGLALCQAIIAAHGGTIEAGDNQPQGTVFRFTLPSEEEDEP
jgi:two-component system sensor histidine kinase KdpD